MYALKGLNKNIENLLILSTLNNGSMPRSRHELKMQYKDYIKSIQPGYTVSSTVDEVEFVSDANKVQNLISLFSQESSLNDMSQETVINCEFSKLSLEVESKSRKALIALKRMDPMLSDLFHMTIENLFYAGSTKAGGGSSSGALGNIWLNPRPTWTLQDYLEFFIHELTHNLLFLDERCQVHYPNYELLELSENFAHSAILKKSRPLDKVVHSLFVVYEVLEFRLKYFDSNFKTYLHPDTEALFNGAFDAISSIKKVNKNLMSEHLWNLLLQLEKRIESLRKEQGESYELSQNA